MLELDLESITAAAEAALSSASHGDPRGSNIRRYLNEHGITSYDIVRKYRLGLHGNRLSIPYLTPAGVIGIVLRCVDDHGSGPGRNCDGAHPGIGKYMPIREGQEKELYNVAAFHDAEDVIGTDEGEIDAIVATEILGIPTVGIPGATQWKAKPWWRLAFSDYRRVLNFADGDEAGKKLSEAVKSGISREAYHLVRCPAGEDVSSMVAAGRAGELLEAADLLRVADMSTRIGLLP